MGYWLYVFRNSLNNRYDVRLHHNNLESLLEYSLQMVKFPDIIKIQITDGGDISVFYWDKNGGISIPTGFNLLGKRFDYSTLMLDDMLPIIAKDIGDKNQY